jgi:predicted kinase
MPSKLPTLIVVSGPAGTGKTTLAHGLAALVGCPAISRDEIKEGIALTTPDFDPAPDDDLSRRTLPTFFAAVRLFLEHGVSLIAEAAFQDDVWKANLASLHTVAAIRVVRCHTDSATARRRIAQHAATRRAHADATLLAEFDGDDGRYLSEFRHLDLDVPTIDVDTTDGYMPTLASLKIFVELP